MGLARSNEGRDHAIAVFVRACAFENSASQRLLLEGLGDDLFVQEIHLSTHRTGQHQLVQLRAELCHFQQVEAAEHMPTY